jgi:hypothetical protein
MSHMPRTSTQLLVGLAGGLVLAIVLLAFYLRPPRATVAPAAAAAPLEPGPLPAIAEGPPAAEEGMAVEPGGINRALALAIEVAQPYLNAGYTMREDYLSGHFEEPASKSLVYQLFGGVDYWFWLGCDNDAATVSLHVYDSSGALAEVEAWSQTRIAAAHVIPKHTGAYYTMLEVKGDAFKRPGSDVSWALAYGFR